MLPKDYIPKAGDCIHDGIGLLIFVLRGPGMLGTIRLSDGYNLAKGEQPTIVYAPHPSCEVGKKLKSNYVSEEWCLLGNIDFPKVEKEMLRLLTGA